MSVLRRRSLGSAQINPQSREKDDCKLKTCKEYNNIVLSFVTNFELSNSCKY